jgi:hypothetical protein
MLGSRALSPARSQLVSRQIHAETPTDWLFYYRPLGGESRTVKSREALSGAPVTQLTFDAPNQRRGNAIPAAIPVSVILGDIQ